MNFLSLSEDTSWSFSESSMKEFYISYINKYKGAPYFCIYSGLLFKYRNRLGLSITFLSLNIKKRCKLLFNFINLLMPEQTGFKYNLFEATYIY